MNRIKLLLDGPDGVKSIVVTADPSATVSMIAEEILAVHPELRGGEHPTLRVVDSGEVLEGSLQLEDSFIRSGTVIEVVAQTPRRDEPSKSRVKLDVIEGPDLGASFFLGIGTHLVGRERGNEVSLKDPLVSRDHATVIVAESSAIMRDNRSAHGVRVAGGLVSSLELAEGQLITLGDTVVKVSILGDSYRSSSFARGGSIPHNRSPRVEARFAERTLSAPSIPTVQPPQPFPWVAAAAPFLLGGVMFAITHNPLSIAFIILSPLLIVSNAISSRFVRRRKERLDAARFTERLEQLESDLASGSAEERAARLDEHPSTADLVTHARRRGPLLWTRRPEHWSFLRVRLGLADQASRISVSDSGRDAGLPEYIDRLDTLAKKYATVSGVPVSESLFDAGTVGVVGAFEPVAGTVRALVAQLVSLHSPAELVVAALVDDTWAEQLESLVWLPHVESPQSPLTVPHLATSSGGPLLAALEELILARTSAQDDRGPTSRRASSLHAGAKVASDPTQVRTPGDVPAVLLVISDPGPTIDRARLVDLCERAADAAIYPLWIAATVDELPAVARTYLDVGGAGTAVAGFVRLGETVESLSVETLSREAALELARSMAAVVDANAHVNENAGIPSFVSLVALHQPSLARGSEVEFVLERWRTNDSIVDRTGLAPAPGRAGDLRAIVGLTASETMRLDLRSQGPHALVGGTSGAGKSEFLQSWILSLALEYSPDRVTFLFLDFKGGTAFNALNELPHSVGIVTDLTAGELDRVLVSLGAEVKKREETIAHEGAKDIRELEARGYPGTPPALVIVVDEFAALANDSPAFVDGIVDIAQRGRALGIHLILATQRPSGVIKPNIRANTNLRIALRVADAEDSIDVIGHSTAAFFDPDDQGRAIAKAGPGRLTTFQSAYVGGWTRDEKAPASVQVTPLAFGADVPAAPRPAPSSARSSDDPRDLERLIASIRTAADDAGIREIERPWRPRLPEKLSLSALEAGPGLTIGRVDIPAQQRQDNVAFDPDHDGSIVFFGASGSGKTVALRSLAVAAGEPSPAGPFQVYGIDFGAGGLRMLESLPHVGSIIQAEDEERLIRLLRKLDDERVRRAGAYRTGYRDYRAGRGNEKEPRILVLIDNFRAFAEQFGPGSAGASWLPVILRVASEGKALGIHLAIAADRPLSLSGAMTANIGKRVILRLADEGYQNDGPPRSAPAGRATMEGLEAQLAIYGDDVTTVGQAAAIDDLARRSRAIPAPPIEAMPESTALSSLPRDHDEGRVFIGVREDTLEPMALDVRGLLVVSGLDGSGREDALDTIARAVARARPTSLRFHLGPDRSMLTGGQRWTQSAIGATAVADLARDIAARIQSPTSTEHVTVFVESAVPFLTGAVGESIRELIEAMKRTDNFLVADAEPVEWMTTLSSHPLRAFKRTMLFQPDQTDATLVSRHSLPLGTGRLPRGRVLFFDRGDLTRFQLAVPDDDPVDE